jgi:hypothetical protein
MRLGDSEWNISVWVVMILIIAICFAALWVIGQ